MVVITWYTFFQLRENNLCDLFVLVWCVKKFLWFSFAALSTKTSRYQDLQSSRKCKNFVLDCFIGEVNGSLFEVITKGSILNELDEYSGRVRRRLCAKVLRKDQTRSDFGVVFVISL